jgi:hypothetical protein
MKHALRTLILAPFLAANFLSAQGLVISQIADGGDWGSTLALTNTTTSSAAVSLTFYKDTTDGATEPWTPTFLENVSITALQLPAASTTFLHTPGTAATVSQGRAELSAPAGVEAYVIYTYRTSGRAQDATAPAIAPTSRVLVPFDNTSNLATALAVVNPNPTGETISVTFKTSDGSVTQSSLPNLPANGQMAFVMPTQFPGTSGQSGLAEFYTTSGTLSIIALRANPTGAFTSAPVYPETGATVISTSGGSGTAGDIIFAGFTFGKSTGSSGFPTTATDVRELVGGQFGVYTPAEWNGPYAGPTYGSCIVYSTTYATGAKFPASPDSFLDAGPNLTLTGPGLPAAGTSVPAVSTVYGPVYSLLLPTGTLASEGTYTLTGPGGTQVKSFSVQGTLPDSFMVTNWDTITAVNRTTPLTINWTGTGFDNVLISLAGTTSSATTVHVVAIACLAAASLGTFSVPTAALANLPALTNGTTGVGALSVATTRAVTGAFSPESSEDTTLTPNLVAGGQVNYGTFAPYFIVTKSLSIQ